MFNILAIFNFHCDNMILSVYSINEELFPGQIETYYV